MTSNYFFVDTVCQYVMTNLFTQDYLPDKSFYLIFFGFLILDIAVAIIVHFLQE